jgi:hypothetical protein
MAQFRQFERPRFFTGKLLTADDLQAEQDYFRGKLRLHNRFLHGWGIVTGLGVTVDQQGTTVAVSPGLALDCAGNELVLSAAEQLSLSGLSGRRYVTIEYLEVQVGQSPSPQGETEFSREQESVRLGLASVNPSLGHSHMGPGTPGCGQSHALCLATIRQNGTHWRVAPVKRRRGARARC